VTDTLSFILLLLALAVVVVVIFRMLGLPPIMGYLLVGAVVGPYATGWVPDTEETRHLAEFGVVFLMFSIGLEFSLARLYSMKRIVFGLGLAQVLVTTLVGTLLARYAGIPWLAGIALGGALAMSSTAMLSKLLTERGELDAPHGREVIGVLLFQDIAVVPLLVLIPALSQPVEAMAEALLLAAFKATVLLALVLFIGQRLLSAWFYMVARQKSAELFMLNVLLVTLGLAWLTELAGLSLALGAFTAGMLIGETEYRYQVEEDIKPFRDVLMGLFFVTIGVKLDLHLLVGLWWQVLLGLLALLLIKSLIVGLLSWRLGASPGNAIRSALWLCAQRGAAGRTDRTGAVDADCALHHPVQRAYRRSLRGQRMADAFHATDADCRPVDGGGKARHSLWLRPERAVSGALSGSGRHQLRCPRPRSGPGARGRGWR
jgi:CPA2 family monovalent cation:H+ antiporter-2